MYVKSEWNLTNAAMSTTLKERRHHRHLGGGGTEGKSPSKPVLRPHRGMGGEGEGQPGGAGVRPE